MLLFSARLRPPRLGDTLLAMNIVVFGPHPDDQEIGLGGTIAKLAQSGHRLLIVDVTDGSPTPRGDRESRLVEAQRALAALQPDEGGVPIQRVLLDLPNRMVEHTLGHRHLFAGVIRAWQAQVVLTPWPEDAHPDHRAVTRIVEDARFDAKLTKIEMPMAAGLAAIGIHALGPPIYPKWLWYYHVSHLRAPIAPSFCLDITGFEQKKIASVQAYASQFGPFDAERSGSAVRGRLVTPDLPQRLLAYSAYMGSLIGVAHAEPILTKEPIGLADLSSIVM